MGDIQFVCTDFKAQNFVVNMITQKGCGPIYVGKGQQQEELGIPFRYEAFKECLQRVKYQAQRCYHLNKKYPNLVSPRIGCGLAMAEWRFVEDIILGVFSDIDITYTVYDLP